MTLAESHFTILRSCLGAFLVTLLLTAPNPSTADTHFTIGERTVSPLDVFRDCEECPEMIVLPMGSFVMGAPLEQSADIHALMYKSEPGVPHGFAHEGPEHEVEIDIPIAMGRNEITRAEWLACVTEGGCSHDPDPRVLQRDGTYLVADDPRHPVMDISYLDALEYVAWLNRKVGAEVYRLPTEAEWEYAARAGTLTKFAQGDTLTREQANFAVMHLKGGRAVPDSNNRNMPVTVDELDAANAWGLRHMAGNLFEQTMSCRSDRHLALPTSSAYLDAFRQISSCHRVVKGGSFLFVADIARAAHRGSSREGSTGSANGFRVVREMKGAD